MAFDPTLAAVRFGSGLSPLFDAPANTGVLMADVDRDFAFAVPTFTNTTPTMLAFQRASRARTVARGTPNQDAAAQAFKDIRIAANLVHFDALRAVFARHVAGPVGFRARLGAFWADHFTVTLRNGAQGHLVTPYTQEAIMPHVNGYFRDMLRAVVTHPMMLMYLQQVRSTGPNSVVGQRRKRGINENLARELLELHTLGANGAYTQTDVRELAELLTGLTYSVNQGFYYHKRMAEPGSETVLGVTYGTADRLENVLSAIDDLAAHPQTARHIAFKIAQAFIADDPPANMVVEMTAVFTATDGFLPAVYRAMLDHVTAWEFPLRKVKPPQQFITSTMRALGMTGADVTAMTAPLVRNTIVKPLRVMGQPWERPLGPDGWSDVSSSWINAQGMAGRMTWAMQAPRQLMMARIPDPRDFVSTALGSLATADVIFAAGAAEVRDEGLGLVLLSPAFQRS